MGVILTKIDKARELLSKSINFKIEGTEKLDIQDSLGRVSSKSIKSKFNLPQTKNSAVDGFAISFKDIGNNEKQKYKVIGMAKAGHPFLRKILKNQDANVKLIEFKGGLKINLQYIKEITKLINES